MAAVDFKGFKAVPLRDGNYIIDGLVYAMSVVNVVRHDDSELVGNRDVSMTCTRCGVRWSKHVTRAELLAAYSRVIPSSCSPLTIMERIPPIKQAVVEWTSGHMCMPRGYAGIPSDILGRVDSEATPAEQYEALATMFGDLATDAGLWPRPSEPSE